jgi:glyoxylase-like metal-dependent hydrolase (beta-lactamase superfamily II)
VLVWACASSASPVIEAVDAAHGVYAFFGAREAPSRANGGHVANQAIIVATGGVIVIDSGASALHAERMWRAIRSQTDKPLAALILTRPVDDAIFGATVLQQHGAELLAHEDAAHLIATRCEICRKNLADALGDDVMTGTRVPRPDRVFKGSHVTVIAGRKLEVLDFSAAAAPGSIAILDHDSGVLFAGGLASFERIPETRDGNLHAWIAALRDLSRRPARAILPAYGPLGNRANLAHLLDYLTALESRTKRAYAARVSLLDAPRTVVVPEYRGWALYDTVHPRNVHHAYIAHERAELARP